MNKLLKHKELILFTIQHAYIDAFSAFVVLFLYNFKSQTGSDLYYMIFFYNFMAFATQWILGLIADKYSAYKYFVLLSLLLPLISIIMIDIHWFVPVGLAGLANALLHVGAGSSVLAIYRNKALYPGLFVSTGALGLLIGNSMTNNYQLNSLAFILVGILLFGLSLKFILPLKIKYRLKEPIFVKRNVLIILLLMLVVFIRGIVGSALFFPWKNIVVYSTIFVISTFLGKVLGGYLADRYGFLKVGVFSLLLSAFLIPFGFTNPYLGLIGIVFFQMTMAITLTLISIILPNRLGFSLGLTTLVLFLSLLPVFSNIQIEMNKFSIMTLILISSVMLYAGIRLFKSNTTRSNFDRI